MARTTSKGYLFVDNIIGKVDRTKIQLGDKAPYISLLDESFSLNADINFNQQTVTINNSDFNWSDIKADLKGEINPEKGYQLEADVVSLPIAKILPQVGVSLPVFIDGILTTDVKITGEIDRPTVKGKLEVVEGSIDSVEFNTIASQFTVNVDELSIDKVTIKPTVGGTITSQALIKTNLTENLLAGKPLY